MKFIGCALALFAFAPGVLEAKQPVSAYAGQEGREIKALASDEIDGLLAGKGLGYAKSAELNGYPGPAHVLELATQLQLTRTQLESSKALHAGMEAQAKAVGAQLVAAEAGLEQLFRSGSASPESLNTVLAAIAKLQSELRGVHLRAHITQRDLLSAEQNARYAHLRGHHGTGGKPGGHGH